MWKLAGAVAVAMLLGLAANADQVVPQVNTQQPSKVDTVKAIRKLTRQICAIYPDVPCVLDDRHADDDDGDDN